MLLNLTLAGMLLSLGVGICLADLLDTGFGGGVG